VNVWSEPGSGSTFTIRLPAAGTTQDRQKSPTTDDAATPQEATTT
jgi:hypothetical protein